VALWLLLQVLHALVAPWTGSGVSYAAHLGGFLAGVLLAISLGGVREARAESRLVRARRYLARGEGWAAAGAYSEYLAVTPGDAQARVERARALSMAGAVTDAQDVYRDALRQAADSGRWDQVLEMFTEARRGRQGAGLSREELARIAHVAEKAGRQGVAVLAYRDLVAGDARDPVVARAWVRLALLLHADPERRAEAADWLDRARRELPPGAWRDYLESAFSPPAGGGAGSGPAASAAQPAPGS
jgi:tetratricopeptide (TPR) repeat protein